MHACYLRRRIGHERLGGMTPFFVLFGYKPDLSTMRVFGCKAWGLIPKAQRTKWDARAVQGVYVGESRVRSARLIYEEKSGKLLETPHAICDEQQFGAAKHPDWQNEPNPAPPSTTTQSALGPPGDLNGADVGVGRSVEVPLPPLATTGGGVTAGHATYRPLTYRAETIRQTHDEPTLEVGRMQLATALLQVELSGITGTGNEASRRHVPCL